MNPQYTIKPVARILTDYQSKFGIPRQSGMTGSTGRIVFEPEFRNPDAVRGIEEFSHIWLLWVFSENLDKGFSPTVRPPRLGGNERRGVFATRAPFRPNHIGMSCVKLESVDYNASNGPVLIVSGGYRLEVRADDSVLSDFPKSKTAALLETLAMDPRPSYHDDPDRIYGFHFAGFEVKFKVSDGILTVTGCQKLKQ